MLSLPNTEKIADICKEILESIQKEKEPVKDETPPPRSVDKVIKQLLEVIPETETKLISELNEYYSNLWNRAPELLLTGPYWAPVGKILGSNIGDLDEEWKSNVHKIFTKSE
jgi:hypothetical protein